MGQVALAQQGSYLSEYPVPGRPQSIAVEAPNRVWFTLPEENQIGRLVVTSPVSYTVTTYTVPTANSQPYDLKYAGGYIWFTERLGNKIGDYCVGIAAFMPCRRASGWRRLWLTCLPGR